VNILASIKSEKKMSLKHWRYRILHWCFGEKAQTPGESNLPKFLYTHYCPLFHLTNLIAILFPLIFVVKIIMAICVGICMAIKLVPWEAIGDRLFDIVEKLFPKRKPKEKPEPTKEQVAAAGLKEEKELFLTRMLRMDYGADDFGRFWRDWCSNSQYFQREAAEHFYITRMAKIIATKERVAERKAKMQQRLIFWTNFSQVFLKWFFNIAYILLAIFVAWVFIKITPWVIGAFIDIIKLMLTFEILPFLIFCGTWLVRLGVPALAFGIVAYGFWRFQIVRVIASAIGSSVVAASPPFVLVGTWLCLPFKWANKGFNNTVEFIGMFYEENCPPVTIISGEDEIIATELKEAE
jgi:hypothetical protein